MVTIHPNITQGSQVKFKYDEKWFTGIVIEIRTGEQYENAMYAPYLIESAEFAKAGGMAGAWQEMIVKGQIYLEAEEITII